MWCDDTPGRRMRGMSRGYLELLARDASEVEFEGPELQARARGADPGTLAALARDKALALQVRRVLERRRRREAELAALFEIAGDLAALRDRSTVLQVIVHRARQLLGTDVTYLTLNDPARDDTFMRVTDGSVSARFQQLRLPFGIGLGGLVARTAVPYYTARYLDDERFRHIELVDAAVEEEGLVAILGMPLLLGSSVIGVLYAADRRERDFTRDEVSLLCSLAAHAAIAIDNARLLEETRAAVAELDAANALIRARSASVERAAAAHDRLAQVVLRGGGVEEVAGTVGEVLGGAAAVLGADGSALTGGPALPDRAEERAALLAATSAPGGGLAQRHGDRWTVPVRAGQEPLGVLVLAGRSDLDEADQRILERGALVTALLLLSTRSAREAERRMQGELLGDLLAAAPRDPDGLRERARRAGLDLDAPYRVAALDPTVPHAATPAGSHTARLAAAAARVAGQRHGLAGWFGDRQLLVLPEPAPPAGALAHELSAALGVPVTVGMSGAVRGPHGAPAAHVEALRCLDALRALRRAGDGATAADLGYVGLLLAEQRDVPAYVSGVLGPVLDYDRRRGTDLVATLRAYFAHAGNLARTAEQLRVHVNTVTQRLDRVGRLVGGDWREPGRALELQLALRLHLLLGTSTAG